MAIEGSSALSLLFSAMSGNASRFVLEKASIANQLANNLTSLWRATGQPAQGAIPGTTAAITLDGADTLFQYDWQVGDTNMAGEYEGEFHYTYAGGALEKLPNDDMIPISVVTAI